MYDAHKFIYKVGFFSAMKRLFTCCYPT